MQIGKCCFDCIFCIPNTDPVECGVHYDCIQRSVHKKNIDPWDFPCPFFMYENKEEES